MQKINTYEIIFSVFAVISIVLAIVNMQNYYIFNQIMDNNLDNAINLIFMVDYVIRLVAAKNKKAFLKNNILDLIAIIPFNSLFKALRILKLFKLTKLFKTLRVLVYFKRLFKRMKNILNQNGTIYLIVFTLLIMLLCSIIISFAENMTLSNALWWSFVTTTTVGYGDISPSTPIGRLTAVVLMFLGIGSISMITGSISTFFIKKNEEIPISSYSYIEEIEKAYELYKKEIISKEEFEKIKKRFLE